MRRSSCRRRGSTILYAIILAGVSAAVAVANLQVAASFRRAQDRREDAARWEYAKAAAVAKLETDLRVAPVSLNEEFNIDVGGLAYAVDTSIQPDGRIALSLANAREGTATTLGLDPRGKHPFRYGLYVEGSATIDHHLTLGSSSFPTHAYFAGSVSVDASRLQTVFGALDVRSASLPGFDTVGTATASVTRPGRMEPSSFSFLISDNESYSNETELNNRTFGNGTDLHVVRSTGKVTVKGTYTGKVVIFTTDKIYIEGPLRAANANSKMVLISMNDAIIEKGGQIDAFIHTNAKFESKKGGTSIYGAVSCGDMDMDKDLTIILDPLFYNWDEIVRYRLPRNGYELD